MEVTILEELDAIHLTDIYPVGIAFLFGFTARLLNLPPLVGFLVAGFVLGALGGTTSAGLQQIADLGVTLLLFTIGLKLKIRDLLNPVIWATASLHMGAMVVIAAPVVLLLAGMGISLFAGIDFPTAVLVGFALSFSSTVFAVKVLEEKGEMGALHGRTAIGILIMQDLFAVLFIALSAGKIPSPWAVTLLALIPLRPLILRLLERAGHGELLVLLGWLLPLGAAALFEQVGVKADLGALLLGVLLAGHRKTDELAKTLLSFKDLFLVGFFLTIGLSGGLTWETVGIALLLVTLIPLKVALYFALMSRFKMRARSASLASLSLANYSEFGLIVGAIGVGNGWLAEEWLSLIAIALSISFVMASPLNIKSKEIYRRWRGQLKHFERTERLSGDELIDPGEFQVMVFGMGRVGAAAYDFLRERWGDVVLGVDRDESTLQIHRQQGRNVILGDATDYDFWSRAKTRGKIRLALLTLPDHQANLTVASMFREFGFKVTLASVAKFDDQAQALREAGVAEVFNLYAEAGTGFAEHVWEKMEPPAQIANSGPAPSG